MIPIIDYKDKLGLGNRLAARAGIDDEGIAKTVKDIIEDVKDNGDIALFKYTAKFDSDKITKDNVRVTADEIIQAYAAVDGEVLAALKNAHKNIYDFHRRQKQQSWFEPSDGMVLGQLVRPIARAGIYVPGGTAAYPSSVFMNAVPAKVAGVGKIVMVTPPSKSGGVASAEVLVAADIAGVDEIYKLGGAQAIAALAYGTESIPAVDKIVGPGNIYVTAAKKQVFGKVGIDMIAGPSEILIIADASANARFIAADMLSQAEHDENAAAILITDDEVLARSVNEQLGIQLQQLPRQRTARVSLEKNGMIILAANMRQAAQAANEIAPEHLELAMDNPFDILGMIENAGSIFMGHWAAEPLGDYYAGPNHVLPTSGTARFSSALSVDDFIKKSGLIYCSQEKLREYSKNIIMLAKSEGLDAHARSISVRTEE